MERFLNPRNDWMFKQIFGTERNKDVLIGFLNAVFEGVHSPIEDVEFLQNHQDPAIASLRQSLVDVRCTDTKKRQFIVEMQCYADPYFVERACVYASRTYTDQLLKQDRKERGKESIYSQVNPVIFLAILDRLPLIESEDYVNHYKLLNIKTFRNDIKQFSYSFIELGKFNKRFEEAKNLLDKWCYFFKNAQVTGTDEFTQIRDSSPLISKAYTVLERCNYTLEEYEAYWHYEMGADAYEAGLIGARDEGKAEGEAKGEAKKAREIARAMLAKGIQEAIIHQCTNLPLEEIKSFQGYSHPATPIGP
jgi:predicted transposase/invertase (TIGR01784 family)